MKRYLLILAVLGVLVGGMQIYKSINKSEKSLSDNSIPEKQSIDEMQSIETITIQHIDEDIKEITLSKTKDFLHGYIDYNHVEPTNYLDEIKPYVTEDFYLSHVTNPKREPLDVLEYSWIPEKSTLSLVEIVQSEDISYSNKVTVLAEVIRTKKTSVGEIEEPMEYWVEFQKISNQWLISGVNIQRGKQYKSPK